MEIFRIWFFFDFGTAIFVETLLAAIAWVNLWLDCIAKEESWCQRSENFEKADLVSCFTCSLNNYVTLRSYIKEIFKRWN